MFYLIVLLQFVFYSCELVKYYPNPIEKYSDEKKVDPEFANAVGFILDISGFEDNEPIYFKITFSESNADNDKYNLGYYINFESTFDTTIDTALETFQSINRKGPHKFENGIAHFYFETAKASNS